MQVATLLSVRARLVPRLVPVLPVLAFVAMIPSVRVVVWGVLLLAALWTTRALSHQARAMVFVMAAVSSAATSGSELRGPGMLALPLTTFGVCLLTFLPRWVEAVREGSLVRRQRQRITIQIAGAATALVLAFAPAIPDGRLEVARVVANGLLFVSLAVWPFTLDAWRRLRQLSPERLIAVGMAGTRDLTIDYGIGDEEQRIDLRAPALGFRESARPAILTVRGRHRTAVSTLAFELGLSSLLLVVTFMVARVLAATPTPEAPPVLVPALAE